MPHLTRPLLIVGAFGQKDRVCALLHYTLRHLPTVYHEKELLKKKKKSFSPCSEHTTGMASSHKGWVRERGGREALSAIYTKVYVSLVHE